MLEGMLDLLTSLEVMKGKLEEEKGHPSCSPVNGQFKTEMTCTQKQHTNENIQQNKK